MKRASVLVVTLVVAFCMALALAGCTASTYTPQAKDQTVEDSALNTPGTLRVGVNASNAPYAAESNGSIVGIDVDIAAALADEMGLKLELVDVGTSTDAAFTNDNVDIVMGVTKSNSAYWLSDAYLTSGIALFSLTEGANPPTSAGSFKVAAQSSSMSAWEVTDHYGSSCLESETDLPTAFENLNTGAVNYVAADSTIGQYVVHTSEVDAYPIALLADTSSYSIAVSSSSTELQDAVADALSSLKNGGIIDVLQKRWLGATTDLSSLDVIKAPENTEQNTTEGDTTTTEEGGNTSIGNVTFTDASETTTESTTTGTTDATTDDEDEDEEEED